MSQEKYTLLETADGSHSLSHQGLSEDFHSRLGARSEARLLYVEASGWQQALSQGSCLGVLDVGLGLGYNALATYRAWQDESKAGGLELVSLERDRGLFEALCDGTGPWMVGWSDWEKAVFSGFNQVAEGAYEAVHKHSNGHVCRWRVFIGDASSAPWHAGMTGIFDFIWQDAFSPKKSPALWTPEWFALLAKLCRKDAVLMTYSVARAVRESLELSGFNVSKILAHGDKKHWLRARLLHLPIILLLCPSRSN